MKAILFVLLFYAFLAACWLAAIYAIMCTYIAVNILGWIMLLALAYFNLQGRK